MTHEVGILKCGHEVRTKIGKIEGIITAACIRGTALDFHVTYELSYFKDGEHKTTWIADGEIDYCDDRSKTTELIGFKQTK